MFGDKPLVDKRELFIDSKGRLFLPSKFTCSEINDRLFIVYNQKLDEYYIYSGKTIENKFNQIENLLLTTTNSDLIKKYKMMLVEFSKSIIKECYVDNTRRINFGKSLCNEGAVEAIGNDDHLIIRRKSKKN